MSALFFILVWLLLCFCLNFSLCSAVPRLDWSNSAVEHSLSNDNYENSLIDKDNYASIDSVAGGGNLFFNPYWQHSFLTADSFSTQNSAFSPTQFSHKHRTQPYYQQAWIREIPRHSVSPMTFLSRKRKRVSSSIAEQPRFIRSLPKRKSFLRNARSPQFQDSILNLSKHSTVTQPLYPRQLTPTQSPGKAITIKTNNINSKNTQQSKSYISQRPVAKAAVLTPTHASTGQQQSTAQSDYSSLLKPQMKLTEQVYESLFSDWKQHYNKHYLTDELKDRAYQQVKKYIDLYTFVQGEVPAVVNSRNADRDLTEYLTEKLREDRGSDFDPHKDKIDLYAHFKNCRFHDYQFYQGIEEERRRFAIFQLNIFKRLDFIHEFWDPPKQLCVRLGDRTYEEQKAAVPVYRPPPKTRNIIPEEWFTSP